MKILKWFAIVIVGIPALLIATIYLRNKIIGPEGWAMDNTEDRLKKLMKDPHSMVIRDSHVFKKTSAGNLTIVICGLVDAKNSFGGYTGGSRFMSRSVSNDDHGTFDTYDVQLEDRQETATAKRVHMESSFDSIYWNPNCIDQGYVEKLKEVDAKLRAGKE